MKSIFSMMLCKPFPKYKVDWLCESFNQNSFFALAIPYNQLTQLY